MDSQTQFFEREIDRTPYATFGWLVGLALLILILGGIMLWNTAGYVKAKQWLAESGAGTADNLMTNAADAARAAVGTSQAAADQQAEQESNYAKAAATQALLDDANTTIKTGVNSAANSAKQAVTSPSPSSSAAVGGIDALQQYLNQ